MNPISRKPHTSRTLVIACMTLAAILSCSYKDENAAEQRAKQFAQNYFNLRFKQASTLCTESSTKWIRYRAANISQEDLDVLNSQNDTAACDIDDISDDGSYAKATITVKNFLRCDSIGKKGIICKEARFDLTMKKIGDNWRIDLKRPL